MQVRFVILLIILSNSLVAQKYGTAVGPRISDTRFGLSLKQRILSQFSVEAMTDLESNSVQFAVIPKYHLPITGDGFNIFFGAGAHFGGLEEYGKTYGYDLIAGIEWKIPAIPLVLGADVKPAYHLRHNDWFEFPATVSVHYVFSKETKAKRIKQREKRRKRKARRERREERKKERQEWWSDLTSN